MSHQHYPHPSSSPLRRSSDPDRQPTQRLSGYSSYAQNAVGSPYDSRPRSSSSAVSSSSLTGAVGAHSMTAAVSQTGYYTIDPTHVSQASPSASPNFLHYSQGIMSQYGSGTNPEDLSPPAHATGMPAYPSYYPMSTTPAPTATGSEDELQFLRQRVRELELVNQSERQRVRELERELAQDQSGALAGPSSIPSGLPGLPPTSRTSNVSPSFEASWRARTDARVRQFCALNRAGNALCAWHETRRERRAYPPRAAPPGVLNCGCTYDEALFEESLARHGVGAYHPGENVRMDPALRNPLLRLLQTRYSYRDGDFERDPNTGNWKENEGPLFWEQRALMGVSNRRSRGDTN